MESHCIRCGGKPLYFGHVSVDICCRGFRGPLWVRGSLFGIRLPQFVSSELQIERSQGTLLWAPTQGQVAPRIGGFRLSSPMVRSRSVGVLVRRSRSKLVCASCRIVCGLQFDRGVRICSWHSKSRCAKQSTAYVANYCRN